MISNLKVFVSSTIKELHNERAILKQTLEAKGLASYLFEYDTGAQPDTARKAFLEEIKQSDLYLGLFWNHYSRPTIDEFNYARSLYKPCFVYVKNYDVGRSPELELFLSEIADPKTGITLHYFMNVVELASFVEKDIQDWLIREWKHSHQGKVSPEIFLKRLVNDFQDLQKFTNEDKRVSIESAEGNPPTKYVIKIFEKGIVDIELDDKPKYSNEHLIEIDIPAEYPKRVPYVSFHTPIFHPNISEDGDNVCTGWHNPSMSLRNYCLRLANMIAYKDYDIDSPVNYKAAQWVKEHNDLLP